MIKGLRKPRKRTRPVVGNRYGWLTVIEDLGVIKRGQRIVRVRCDRCEARTTKAVRLDALTPKGEIVSCGCFGREQASRRARQRARVAPRNRGAFAR